MSFKFCASITVEKHDVRQAEAELVFFNEPPLIVEDVRRWQADHLHSELLFHLKPSLQLNQVDFD